MAGYGPAKFRYGVVVISLSRGHIRQFGYCFTPGGEGILMSWTLGYTGLW
jgi:hypothetical protein